MLYLLLVSMLAISSPIAISLEKAHTQSVDGEDCISLIVQDDPFTTQYEQMEALGFGYDPETDCLVITYSAVEIIGPLTYLFNGRKLIFWREYFGVFEGELRLVRVVRGTYIPEQNHVEWPE